MITHPALLLTNGGMHQRYDTKYHRYNDANQHHRRLKI